LSHTLPAALPTTMPSTVVVDYSGRLSQTELGAINSYAVRTHYSPHVVVLSPATRVVSTQGLALDIAQTWKLEPNGFLLVVNTSNDSAAMVAGTSLQNKGINGKYVNEHLMPMRFEKEYIQGNLAGAIRSTMTGVERRLNLIALRGDRATHNQHQSSSNWPVGLTFISFFFFFVVMAGIMGKASVSTRPRRMQLGGGGYQNDADLASDLDRIHQVLGGAPAVKQVPMKEFVQRASLNRNTQNSLDAMPAPHAQVEDERTQLAHELIDKVLASESRAKDESSGTQKPFKLIFEGTHAPQNPQPAARQSNPVVGNAPVVSEPTKAFDMPVYKPYEFPEDETAVPSVGSLEPAAEFSVPDFAANANSAAVDPLVASSNSTDAAQTTESILKVDQYAQAMKSEPDQAAELPAWQPATYTMPPAPVLPGAPVMPVSQFAASMNSDFTDVLNRGSTNYASQQQSGFMTSGTTDSSSGGKEQAAPGVCPKCQSEKSPDFSFCLRCGHMFV
jgi:uncharacterized membrane protein YgcG